MDEGGKAGDEDKEGGRDREKENDRTWIKRIV